MHGAQCRIEALPAATGWRVQHTYPPHAQPDRDRGPLELNYRRQKDGFSVASSEEIRVFPRSDTVTVTTRWPRTRKDKK